MQISAFLCCQKTMLWHKKRHTQSNFSLKKALVFLHFLRESATAVFRRKYTNKSQ